MHVAFGASLALLSGYLVGSVPLGLLVARAVGGIDIRRHGTGMPRAAVLVLGLFLQGLLPPVVARLAGAPEAVIAALGGGGVSTGAALSRGGITPLSMRPACPASCSGRGRPECCSASPVPRPTPWAPSRY